MISWWLLCILNGVIGEFYAGRIKPGKFEYSKLNGLMLVNDAKEKCEIDLACAGFTFKGSFKTVNHPMHIYFFHIIPQNNDFKYFYWSTYKVTRNFVKLSNVTISSELKYSEIINNSKSILAEKDNLLDKCIYEQLRKNDVVAIQPQGNRIYSRLDFTDILPSTNSDDVVILNLNLNHLISHTLPKIDRCCKLKNGEVKYDGFDNIDRISCNISKKAFFKRYINERKAVVMKNCQTEWMAKNWTIENLLDRYKSLKNNPWDSYFQKTVVGPIQQKYLDTQSVKFAFNIGHLIKVFQKLRKDARGWIDDKEEAKNLMLDLFEEYSFPKPMPEGEDQFHNFHVDTNQAYLILATANTGTVMHMDPEYTDAFNALISGEKWWALIPKDLYEFKSEFACDPQCSEPYSFYQFGVWFTHVLPQIRNRTFYGQKVKSFLQTSGETLYLPNGVLHSVWNVSPTIAVGDNPLYETSFDEWIGAGGDDISSSSWIRSRILNLSKGKTKSMLKDILGQIDEAIAKHKIM